MSPDALAIRSKERKKIDIKIIVIDNRKRGRKKGNLNSDHRNQNPKGEEKKTCAEERKHKRRRLKRTWRNGEYKKQKKRRGGCLKLWEVRREREKGGR